MPYPSLLIAPARTSYVPGSGGSRGAHGTQTINQFSAALYRSHWIMWAMHFCSIKIKLSHKNRMKQILFYRKSWGKDFCRKWKAGEDFLWRLGFLLEAKKRDNEVFLRKKVGSGVFWSKRVEIEFSSKKWLEYSAKKEATV